jgi:hypothetical protein
MQALRKGVQFLLYKWHPSCYQEASKFLFFHFHWMLRCALHIIVCPFDSDYPFGICEQFLVRLDIFHQNDIFVYKGNNTITELRIILQRESQNS